MRTLYFAPELAPVLPAEAKAIEVAPLLRELILEIVRRRMLSRSDPAERRLAELAVDLLGSAETLPASLPMPTDPRALRLAERLHREPACEGGLSALAKDAGASLRTMQRLFLDETGLRLSEWRQRLRLVHAAGLLAEGVSVTQAGLEAGYAGTSAFIAAFRRRFGQTPAQMRGPRRRGDPAGCAKAAALSVRPRDGRA